MDIDKWLKIDISINFLVIVKKKSFFSLFKDSFYMVVEGVWLLIEL